MAGLLTHIGAYAAVNGFLVAVWVLVAGGSTEKLQSLLQDPGSAMDLGFWPVWPILAWGVLLVIHIASTIGSVLFGRRARRRRERIAKAVIGSRRDARAAARDPKTPQPAQRRWVTVMFSDISESTKHNEDLGDEEWTRVLKGMRTIARAAISGRNGTELGTAGDGMLAHFESPADAVLCAVDIQSGLSASRASGEFTPDVRIGIHAGEAVEHDEGLTGRVLNLASRVTDSAAPGEILVTEPVADQLVGKLELEDKGLRELKGLAQPRHILGVKWSQPDG